MLRAIGALLIAVVLFSVHARAEERIALLIGNKGYKVNVGPLQNPHFDIYRVGGALRSLNFKVTSVKDADYKAMDTAIKRHIQAVRREGPGTISFVYYSGHGAADPDTKINYLIPVDVANADDDDLWINSLNLNSMVEALQSQASNAVHFVVFDACRNELKLTRKGKRALTDRGFAPMAYAQGVLVAYATSPGKTATDAGDRGAPYAKALASEIVVQGVEAITMFRNVALRVKQEIGQDPWLSASTLPSVYLAGKNSTGIGAYSAPQLSGPRPDAAEELIRICREVGLMSSAPVLDTLSIRYKGTAAADCIAARLKELDQSASPPASCQGAEVWIGSTKRCQTDVNIGDLASASPKEKVGPESEDGPLSARVKVIAIPAGKDVPPLDIAQMLSSAPPHKATEIEPKTASAVAASIVTASDVEASACRAHLARLANNPIYFGGDHEIKALADIEKLQRLAEGMKHCPNVRIAIEGHSDIEGSVKHNHQLSVKRAQAAAAHLVKEGVQAERLQVTGFGATRPAASNDTAQKKGRNRRVEFVVRDN